MWVTGRTRSELAPRWWSGEPGGFTAMAVLSDCLRHSVSVFCWKEPGAAPCCHHPRDLQPVMAALDAKGIASTQHSQLNCPRAQPRSCYIWAALFSKAWAALFRIRNRNRIHRLRAPPLRAEHRYAEHRYVSVRCAEHEHGRYRICEEGMDAATRCCFCMELPGTTEDLPR